MTDHSSSRDRLRALERRDGWATARFVGLCIAGAIGLGFTLGLLGLALVVLTEGWK